MRYPPLAPSWTLLYLLPMAQLPWVCILHRSCEGTGLYVLNQDTEIPLLLPVSEAA